MAYVYSRVANDKDSNQTPHYGHFDGDGDFVFAAPGLNELEGTDEKDLDRLVTIPYPDEEASPDRLSTKVHRAKGLLAK